MSDAPDPPTAPAPATSAVHPSTVRGRHHFLVATRPDASIYMGHGVALDPDGYARAARPGEHVIGTVMGVDVDARTVLVDPNVPPGPPSPPPRIQAVACRCDSEPEVGADYGPEWCARCWGRGWHWSDGVPPVGCVNGVPCGRAEPTCVSCGRTRDTVALDAWMREAALLEVRLRRMSVEERRRWVTAFALRVRDLGMPMAADALEAGV